MFILGVITFFKLRSSSKQQLNSEKWDIGYLSAFAQLQSNSEQQLNREKWDVGYYVLLPSYKATLNSS